MPMKATLQHDVIIQSSFVRRVADSARRTGLLRPGDMILVAVSGGPDSVALLSVLAALASSWRLRVRAVHFNYGLRGEESDQDALFVTELCKRMGVELTTEHIDLQGSHGGAGSRRGSLQEAARQARYSAMQRIGVSLGVDKIAVGHTADDQAETLLMWMIRGAGPAGLSGIPPVRDPLIIRPLLQMTRMEVLSYLKAEGLAFRTDSTNAKPLYLRNRIRQDVLPVLRRFNPSIVEALRRQADILREEQVWLEQMTAEHFARIARLMSDGELVVDRKCLVELPVALQRRIIRDVVRRVAETDRGPGFAAVAAIQDCVVNGRTGSSLVVHGIRVSREYDALRFGSVRRQDKDRPVQETWLEVPLPVPSTQLWPLTGQLIQMSLVHSVPSGEQLASSRSRNVALADADSVTLKLSARCWRPGDIFQPLGMGGRRKKLQDYFSDIKLSRTERNRIPLVVAPEGILWIAGHRMDHRFRLTSTTKRVIMIRLADPQDLQETH